MRERLLNTVGLNKLIISTARTRVRFHRGRELQLPASLRDIILRNHPRLGVEQVYWSSGAGDREHSSKRLVNARRKVHRHSHQDQQSRLPNSRLKGRRARERFE